MPPPDWIYWLSWEFWAEAAHAPLLFWVEAAHAVLSGRAWAWYVANRENILSLATIIAGVIGIPLLAIRTFAANRSARAALEQAKAANQSAAAALEQAKTALKQAETASKRHDEQTRADRERRITESFAKAVELLGSNNLETRLGAIYTLERISKEKHSEHDYYWPIMETLTAFVRERAPEKQAEPASVKVRPAIQAVLTVLGRREEEARKEDQSLGRRLDLANTDLRGATLREARLERANLTEAHLEDARLTEAHLKDALLWQAHLEGADLLQAHLEGAYLGGAHFEGADLTEAHLEGSELGGAHFEGADLLQAHLEGAYLGGAHFEGADLRKAVGLTQEQLAQAFGDATTKVADELRPAHWPAAANAQPEEPDNPE
jgi:Pentapeptide repeats (8 copies)